MATQAARTLFVGLKLKAQGFVQAARRAAEGLGRVGDEAGSADDKTEKFQKTMMRLAKMDVGIRALASGLRLVGKAASTFTDLTKSVIQTAASFEEAFVGVAKVVDGLVEVEGGLLKVTKAGVQFRADIRKIATELPFAAEQIFSVAQSAGQLGVAKEDLADFTKVVLELGVSSDLAAEQGAFALARLSNIAGLASDQTRNLASTLSLLGSSAAATESEIAEMSLRLASAGKTVGLSADQVLGFATAMTEMGIKAEAGGSAMSRVLMDIASSVATGGEKLDQFAEIAGLSASDFAEMFQEDAAGAVLAFVEGLGQMSDEGGNAIVALDQLGLDGIRTANVLLTAANNSDKFRERMAMANKEFQEGNFLASAAEKFYATFNARMTVLWNTIRNIADQMGERFLPRLTELVDEAIPRLEELTPLFLEFTDEAIASIEQFVTENDISWEKIVETAKSTLTKAGEIVKDIFDLITDTGGKRRQAFEDLGKTLGEAIVEGIKIGAKASLSVLGDILPALTGLGTVSDIEKSGGLQEFLKKNPGFASGGIVSGPTSGFPAMLHGTEMIVPESGGGFVKNFFELLGAPGFAEGGFAGSAGSALIRRADLETLLETTSLSFEEFERVVDELKALELGGRGKQLSLTEAGLDQLGNLADTFLADALFGAEEEMKKTGDAIKEKAQAVKKKVTEDLSSVEEIADPWLAWEAKFDAEFAEVEAANQGYVDELISTLGAFGQRLGPANRELGKGVEGMTRLLREFGDFTNFEAAEAAVKNVSTLSEDVITAIFDEVQKNILQKGFMQGAGAIAAAQQAIQSGLSQILMLEQGLGTTMATGIDVFQQMQASLNTTRDAAIGLGTGFMSAQQLQQEAMQRFSSSVVDAGIEVQNVTAGMGMAASALQSVTAGTAALQGMGASTAVMEAGFGGASEIREAGAIAKTIVIQGSIFTENDIRTTMRNLFLDRSGGDIDSGIL